MADSYFSKTADEVKDYTVDWCHDIGSDIIAASTWIADPTDLILTTPAPTNTSNSATVWISCGIPGGNYLVTNTIVTVQNRELEQRIIISINPPGY
jgi:hypothetical protein